MSSKRQGRAPGPKKVPFALRLSAEHMRDLRVLSVILDGEPSINGLIQTAVRRYVEVKLKNARIKAAYDARVSARLKIIG